MTEQAWERELYVAAKTVFDGLNARIDDASDVGKPVPVYDGIAQLHDALNKVPDEIKKGA